MHVEMPSLFLHQQWVFMIELKQFLYLTHSSNVHKGYWIAISVHYGGLSKGVLF